jgi:hypothetical protein
VAPQSGAKDQFYYTVYYITLKSKMNLGEYLKMEKDRVRSQN